MTDGSSRSEEKLVGIPGNRHVEARLRRFRIVGAADDDPPFAVDAEVEEEDTWLALSADPTLVAPPGHPVRVMTAVWEAQPERAGSVVVRPGNPLALLAVVHDMNEEPSWREEWVREALHRALAVLEERGLEAVKLPLLGARHGRLPASRFIELLVDALETHDTKAAAAGVDLFPRRIWVACDASERRRLFDDLAG